MSDKLTCDDVLKYDHLASKVPSFLLGRMAKRNSNLVGKFESQIRPRLANMNDHHRHLIDVVLNSDISELQAVMDEAYEKTGTKQYKILADPKNAEFIESNLDEIRKLL
ncbi:MAG: hypothetical protein E7Z83_02260 [Methanobrevibacter sp.]|nr:hypothetical protein [Methanobrevibacter sp.]MBE6489662.1 hypothetical protein [Methanobrevibacter sp.]